MSPCSVELYLHSSSPASQICARPSLPLCLRAWFCSQVRADAQPGPEQQMQGHAVPGCSWLEVEPRERRHSCCSHSLATAVAGLCYLPTKSIGMLLWGAGTSLGTTGFKGFMLGRVRGGLSEGGGAVLHRITKLTRLEKPLSPTYGLITPMALKAISSLFLSTSRHGDSQHLQQPTPMPSPSFCQELLCYVQPKLPLVQLKAIPLVWQLIFWEKRTMSCN